MSRANGQIDEATARFLYAETLSDAQQQTLRDRIGANPEQTYPGPFADQFAAAANGVPLNGAYRNSDGYVVTRSLVTTNKVAFVGDSRTYYATLGDGNGVNGTGIYNLYADYGYCVWLRAFMEGAGGGWDFAADPTGDPVHDLNFSIDGGTSVSVWAAKLAVVKASNVKVIYDDLGLNDAYFNVSVAASSAARVAAWRELKANGQLVIAGDISPFGLDAIGGGNTTGVLSARVVAHRAQKKADAIAENVPYVGWDGQLDTVPGNAIAIPGLLKDGIHWSISGSNLGARLNRAQMQNLFVGTIDIATYGTPLTANVGFAGTAPVPTSWQYFNSTVGGSTISRVLTAAPGGTNYWDINFTDGGDLTTNLVIANNAANLTSPASKKVEAWVVVQALTGNLTHFEFTAAQGGSDLSNILDGADTLRAPNLITPADGPVVLRGHPFMTGGGVTRIDTAMKFNGNCTVRLHKAGAYIVP